MLIDQIVNSIRSYYYMNATYQIMSKIKICFFILLQAETRVRLLQDYEAVVASMDISCIKNLPKIEVSLSCTLHIYQLTLDLSVNGPNV